MIVPSRAESLPYVVLEAAAAGLQLVATDVGGISEIVEGSDTGLVMCDDVPGLAGAIRHILADPELAEAKADRLRDLVGKRFTVEKMTADICEMYQRSAKSLAA
jgi:glycosyltransferase involved in cell wall biosynthesis